MEQLWAEILLAPIGAAGFLVALAASMTGRPSPATAFLLTVPAAILLFIGLRPYSFGVALAASIGLVIYITYLCRDGWLSKARNLVLWLGHRIGYVDGRWTWAFQRPWVKIGDGQTSANGVNSQSEHDDPLQFDNREAPSFGYARNPDGTARIVSVVASGTNRTNDPVALTEAMVRSDVTNVRLPFFFMEGNDRVSIDTHVILPRGRFHLIAEPSYRNLAEFRAAFGALSYIVRYDGGEFVRHFTEPEIGTILTDILLAPSDEQPPTRTIAPRTPPQQ